MSSADSAITEGASGSLNDTEKMKSGLPAAHRNDASWFCISLLNSAKPARFAEGTSSSKDALLAISAKYLICLATLDARSIRDASDCSVIADASLSAAAGVLRRNDTTFDSNADAIDGALAMAIFP
jgi:hypothetical protein